jgi:hypothetical protein
MHGRRGSCHRLDNAQVAKRAAGRTSIGKKAHQSRPVRGTISRETTRRKSYNRVIPKHIWKRATRESPLKGQQSATGPPMNEGKSEGWLKLGEW